MKLKAMWGFPKIRGTIWGVPIIRIIVFWGLYWGPPILGNYHMGIVRVRFSFHVPPSACCAYFVRGG